MVFSSLPWDTNLERRLFIAFNLEFVWVFFIYIFALVLDVARVALKPPGGGEWRVCAWCSRLLGNAAAVSLHKKKQKPCFKKDMTVFELYH